MAFYTTQRFFPLFVTQFLGAFNDNVLKNALIVLITYRLTEQAGEAAQMVALAAGLFILPFFIFSATAGQLADKFDRARLTRILKCFEIIIMLVAASGFYFEHASFLMFVLFAMGTQSTFFGPIKYALLPQHLHKNELVAANGIVESGTFLAILLGTILGGVLVLQPGGLYWVSGCLIGVALLGYFASRHIPASPPPEPELKLSLNIALATWRIIGYSRQNRRVFMSIMGISWFWVIGATLLAQFPPFVKSVLYSDESVVTLFYAVFSLGIAVGSLLCTWLAKGRINMRYVPWAALGMSLAIADCYLASSQWSVQSDELMGLGEFLEAGGGRIALDFTLVAICGGIFVVPLYALMQHESEPKYLARIIAANNVLNALFMVIAAVAILVLLKSGLSIPEIFLVLALVGGIVALFVARQVGNNKC